MLIPIFLLPFIIMDLPIFSLGKNDEVNEMPKISLEPTITHQLAKKPNITHVLTQPRKPTITHELAKKPTHEVEKIALVLSLTGGFVILMSSMAWVKSCYSEN